MRNLLTTLAASALLAAGTSTGAFAYDCSGATKAAAGDCSSPCGTSVKNVAAGDCSMKSDCGAKASATSLASADGAELNMAPGGADTTTVKMGYGLDHKVPDFTLTDTKGQSHNLSDFAGKPVMLVFYNQKCPYVVEVADRLNKFAEKYSDNVTVLGIDAGINNSPEEIASYAENRSFPILVDRTSNSARKFEATRTPEVFLLDGDGVIRYHGAFDSGQGSAEDRKTYAKDALKALMNGETPDVQKTKAFGCTIKFNPETSLSDETASAANPA